jgi:hypothetical protein
VIKGFLFKKQTLTPVLTLSPEEMLASAKNYFSIVIFHDYPPLILFELLTKKNLFSSINLLYYSVYIIFNHPKDGTAINLNDNKLKHLQHGMLQVMNSQ